MTQKNTVSVKFLGIQRLTTGKDSITVELSGTMCVLDVLELVKSRYPELDLNEDNVVTAVNQEKAHPEKLLKAGDTISFLPFISGG